MSTARSVNWARATATAIRLRDAGAEYHRTRLINVWWVDPVPKHPAPAKPATYWVTRHADGCFSCVCSMFLETKSAASPCSHIARVCREIGATPIIWAENPACVDVERHSRTVNGYVKEALHHPQCGCPERPASAPRHQPRRAAEPTDSTRGHQPNASAEPPARPRPFAICGGWLGTRCRGWSNELHRLDRRRRAGLRVLQNRVCLGHPGATVHHEPVRVSEATR